VRDLIGRAKQITFNTWLQASGSLTGAAGALYVGDATSEGRCVGFALFAISNLAFAVWKTREKHWWILAMQTWYMYTTIRGLFHNW